MPCEGLKAMFVIVLLTVGVVVGTDEIGGFDLVFRGDALQEVQDLINPIIVSRIEASVAATPEMKGSHYKAYDFKVTALTFSAGELYPIDNGIAYQFTLVNFRFEYTITVSYLESCTWSIQFYNNQPLPLLVPLEVDLSQENPTFTTDPSWVVGLEGITLKQKCESFLCDANAVCLAAGGSVGDGAQDSFNSGWLNIPPDLGIALTRWIDSHFSSISLLPTLDLPWRSNYSVGLDFRGLLTAQNTTPASGLIQSPTVFTHGAFFLNPAGNEDPANFVPPPFSPTVIPDMLTAPPDQLSFFLTDFFFHSLVWAVEASGTLNGPILPSMVPEGSPFQLNTGNTIMRTIAPGVSTYGSTPMMVEVDLSTDASTSLLDISDTGIQSSNNTILSSFYTYNTTTKEKGTLLFSLSQEFQFNVDVLLNDTLPELRIVVDVSQLKMTGTTATYSSVGRVNTIAATTYTNSGLKYLQHTILSEPFAVPLPISSASFKSPPTLNTTTGYLYGGGDFLPTFHPKYISEIIVVAAHDSDDAPCPTDYVRIQQYYDSDGDFNQKGGGYFVYLCTKLDNTPGAQMLTALYMVADKHEDDAVCPSGYVRIPEGADSDGDFNQKAGGYYIYVCAQYGTIPETSDGTGIAHLGVVAHHSKVSSPCDKTSGYAPNEVPYGVESDSDYNQKAGGHWIYLCSDQS